jgi:hypothetical protein
MTTEERLDRIEALMESIARRHESLAHSVELLSTFQREDRAQITHNLKIVHDSIKRLENIARAHEDRISDLEEGQ